VGDEPTPLSASRCTHGKNQADKFVCIARIARIASKFNGHRDFASRLIADGASFRPGFPYVCYAERQRSPACRNLGDGRADLLQLADLRATAPLAERSWVLERLIKPFPSPFRIVFTMILGARGHPPLPFVPSDLLCTPPSQGATIAQ
jgi:hypothetical protein